jgi:predicted nucleic acid-binding protein
MVNKYIFDSSVWIALFHEGDTLHREASESLEKLGDVDVVVPYCVVFEVCNVLTYKHSHERAKKFLDYLQNNTNIIMTHDTIEPSLTFFQRIDQKISLTDIHIITTARLGSYTLLTFDKQMEKIYRSI